MGLFGLDKKPMAAEMAGRNITNIMIDAESCWNDVCRLRSYKTPAPIATCEMAFARAALVISLLIQGLPDATRERVEKAAGDLIREAFEGQDTPETAEWYGNELEMVARERVAAYAGHTWMCDDLAAQLGIALSVPGHPAVEAAFMFEDVAKRTKALLAKIRIV